MPLFSGYLDNELCKKLGSGWRERAGPGSILSEWFPRNLSQQEVGLMGYIECLYLGVGYNFKYLLFWTEFLSLNILNDYKYVTSDLFNLEFEYAFQKLEYSFKNKQEQNSSFVLFRVVSGLQILPVILIIFDLIDQNEKRPWKSRMWCSAVCACCKI